MTTVTSWRTHKEPTGVYTATVYEFAYQVPEIVLKCATFATRARAEGWAKKWVRFLRCNERRAATA